MLNESLKEKVRVGVKFLRRFCPELEEEDIIVEIYAIVRWEEAFTKSEMAPVEDYLRAIFLLD